MKKPGPLCALAFYGEGHIFQRKSSCFQGVKWNRINYVNISIL